jgi:ubiquitin thioesterase protein OTUB1|eukprot:CAMPEP_0174298788 /NCGR_PEP_ID=MMETSP0809-20121228/54831_1 /TAXON_ID=73025 ORGANISM="Eutreptiella gymnastica-like, Strain CCMP1594" /NCGR_SAMPLE_ID=MMETSP0809 /ASSEMBLY_ACC=CAM_ASM_000658 /LENGTH=256 /DNA_ID=CAMNT_0015403495 /DNA_START=48 /DNA_END=818 /DNA_ORIENTATION=-
MSHAIPDDVILASMQQLKAEQTSFPLVGDMQGFDELEQEFQGGAEVVLQKIQQLKAKYTGLRRVRRDGNCFIRAFVFGLLETLIGKSDTSEVQRILECIRHSKTTLVASGLEEFTFEDFHETFVSELERVANGECTPDHLLDNFRQQDVSDSIVVYVRMLMSHHIKARAADFSPFLNEDVTSYCRREVDPMGVECDQVHIMALTTFLGVGVRIEYLDLSNADTCIINHHDIPDTCAPSVYLLYRPGHYDVLYTDQQ